jgi:hypothetical protein
MSRVQATKRLVTYAVLISFLSATIMPYGPPASAAPIRLAQADETVVVGDVDPVGQTIDAIFAALEDLDRELDHGAFDVTVKAEQLAFDPRQMFAFVRDGVIFEPYVGALRGAKGTLQAKAGNALDQSLLLATLLNEAGYQTKIATGTLSDGDIERVLAGFFATEHRPLEEPWAEDQWQSYLTRLGAVGEDVPEAFADRESLLDQASVDFWDRVDFHQSLIDGILPAVNGVDTLDLPAETRQHFWVRYLDENNTWIDLDPTIPDTGFGMTVANFVAEYDDVPEALWHGLTLTSTVFVAAADDTIEEHVVLEHSLRIADLVGRGMVFRNLPDKQEAPNAADIVPWIESITEFTATLTVAGTLLHGMTFDLDGNIFEAPAGVAGAVRESLEKQFEGPLSVLDSIGGDTPEGDADDGQRLVGQSLTYALSVPAHSGTEPTITTYSRDLLSGRHIEQWDPAEPRLAVASHDRSSAIADLLTRVEIAPVVGRLSPAYLAASEIESLRANRSMLISLIEGLRDGAMPAQTGDEMAPRTVPFAALGLAADTQGLMNALLENRFPDTIHYQSESSLVAYETGYGLGDEGVTGRRGYDIIHSRPRAVARKSGAPDEEVVRLAGVIETLLESELLRPPSHLSLAKPLGTGEVFEAAVEQNIEFTLLIPGASDARLMALSIPENVKIDIATDLARGYAIVVPARPADLDGKARIAWWRIDPKAGATLGMLPGGGGSAFSEDAIVRFSRSLDLPSEAMAFSDILIGFAVGFVCIIESDAANSESPTSARIADGIACVVLGLVATFGIWAPGSWARRMTIAATVLAAFIAGTNRVWLVE